MDSCTGLGLEGTWRRPSLYPSFCHYVDEEMESQRGKVTWPRSHRRSVAMPKLESTPGLWSDAFAHVDLLSQVGCAGDSEVLTMPSEQSSARH